MGAPALIDTGNIATWKINVADNPLPSTARVYSIQIENSINRIPTARIVFLDGSVSNGDFPLSSSSILVPGAKINIALGYEFDNSMVFNGIITKQSIRIDNLVGSTLEVECRDVAIKMIATRKSLQYSNQKDSDIISSILGTYSDLEADVSATEIQWPEQIQYYVTDWDYILSRAESNGQIVIVNNGKVTVASPGASTTSVCTIKYGLNLLSFNAELDSVSQIKKASATAWDFKTQALVTGESSTDYSGPGNISGESLAGVIGLSEFQLQTTTPQLENELTNWSKAQVVKREYAKIRGTATINGASDILPGNYITMTGLGDRFNGDYLVSGVRNILDNGNWITEIDLGMDPNWFIEEPDVIAPAASGLVPAAQGLFNGVVKKITEDPDSQFRVLVEIPLFDPDGEGLWARLTNFYSTSGAGVFFMPEIGDEVILGFLNQDPRYPIILGSVYSADTLKPYTDCTPNDKNSLKAIVSKSGIALEYNDEDIVFTIKTPNKNQIVISDKDKNITISDQNNNSIVMSDSGITITSDKNISLVANQKISLDGKQGVSITSETGDINVSGVNIKEEADEQYSAQSSASMQLNGGLETTIKGTMVMIN